MYNPNQGSGWTGRQFEEYVFGLTRENPKSKVFRDLYKKAEENDGYLSYDESLKFAKEVQVGDPTDPESAIANDIHATVVDFLSKEKMLEDDEYGEVKFYSSLHTPLDYCHKVDGFIQYGDTIITMDATLNKNKDTYAADLIIREIPDSKFEKEEYLKYIKTIADKIVDKIKGDQVERDKMLKEQKEITKVPLEFKQLNK
mgnify:CR=1 FL=1